MAIPLFFASWRGSAASSLDQSIEFDGAYRILSGQVPYKDFLIPVGPAVFCLQAMFFKLFGVNFTAYLIGAARPNLLATALAMFIIWTLFPRNHWPSLIAGFLTATWFYPPYGTPNMEQTAFLFAMIGIACMIGTMSQRRAARNAAGRVVPHGRRVCCFVVSQQTERRSAARAGLCRPFTGDQRAAHVRELLTALAWWLCGIFGSTAVFALWLVRESNPSLFYKHFFTLPGQMGARRIR